MKSCKRALIRWVALWVAVLCPGLANATTVIPPSFEEITDRAELIFVGKVLGSRAEWRTVGGKRVIFTLVEFEKQEVLKGEAAGSITLQFLGGTVGDTTLEVAGVPKFNSGDRELLFVKGNGVQFCPLVGVYHGKFGVRREEQSDRDIVVTHTGKALRDVAEIGSGEGAEFGKKQAKLSALATAEPLSLNEFKATIQARLAKSAERK